MGQVLFVWRKQTALFQEKRYQLPKLIKYTKINKFIGPPTNWMFKVICWIQIGIRNIDGRHFSGFQVLNRYEFLWPNPDILEI